MQFLFYCLFVLVIAVADQISKYFTVACIPLYETQPFLPGIVELTYVKNTGAAFSSFEGARWMFVALFAVLAVLLIWEYFKKPLPFSTFERWCLAAIFGGGLGNCIDRVRLGYVVDMIKTEFIQFPVFNVADIFITCGCIAMMVSLIFFNKKFWKD